MESTAFEKRNIKTDLTWIWLVVGIFILFSLTNCSFRIESGWYGKTGVRNLEYSPETKERK